MDKKIKEKTILGSPIIIPESKAGTETLAILKKTLQIAKVVDIFANQIQELFEIKHPDLINSINFNPEFKKFKEKNCLGNYVYLPWNKNLLHIVKERDLFLLRTNRNKDLITEKEQQKLAKFTVCIAGLSIGANIATNLAYSGISSTIKIADHDILQTTNLNRVKACLKDVGSNKIDITARQIYEINPYAKITSFPKGINNKNLKDFIYKNPGPSLIFDTIDDFEMKVRIRIEARKAKIPVIMLTSLGDNLLIDVERYDINPKTAIFNDLIGKTAEHILLKPITEADKKLYAVQIVGKQNVPERAMESLRKIGKTLVGRPQLLSTVIIGSGVAAYLARQVALGLPLNSGRKLVKFDRTFKI